MKHKTNPMAYMSRANPRGGHREPCYSAAEVMEVFGYKRSASLWSAVGSGKFPQPDYMNLYTNLSGVCRRKAFWKRSTVEKEKQRMKEEGLL